MSCWCVSGEGGWETGVGWGTGEGMRDRGMGWGTGGGGEGQEGDEKVMSFKEVPRQTSMLLYFVKKDNQILKEAWLTWPGGKSACKSYRGHSLQQSCTWYYTWDRRRESGTVPVGCTLWSRLHPPFCSLKDTGRHIKNIRGCVPASTWNFFYKGWKVEITKGECIW